MGVKGEEREGGRDASKEERQMERGKKEGGGSEEGNKRERGGGVQREKECLLLSGPLPKWPQQPELGQVFHPGHPCGYMGPSTWYIFYWFPKTLAVSWI